VTLPQKGEVPEIGSVWDLDLDKGVDMSGKSRMLRATVVRVEEDDPNRVHFEWHATLNRTVLTRRNLVDLVLDGRAVRVDDKPRGQ
jgi:hypothetical protein